MMTAVPMTDTRRWRNGGDRLCAVIAQASSSARVRILAWMLLLVAIALTVTSTAMAVVLTTQSDERVNERLAEEIHEFRRFVETQRRPGMHDDAEARALLESSLQAIVPDEHQTFVALADGHPLPVAGGPSAVLVRDPALVAQFAATDRPVYGDAVTSLGPIRYAAVPVAMEPSPTRGTFVVVGFPDAEHSAILEVFRTDLLLGLGALLLAAAVGWMFAGRLLTPLRMLRETADSISETDFSRRIPVRGDDEIAQLTAIFNGMLDRIQEAFSTQRQFINEASHELRTPITIIQGNLELLDDDPARRHDRIIQVIDELNRMNRMVEERHGLGDLGAGRCRRHGQDGHPDQRRTRGHRRDRQRVRPRAVAAAGLGSGTGI
jgi:HAMP domain-containing protein